MMISAKIAPVNRLFFLLSPSAKSSFVLPLLSAHFMGARVLYKQMDSMLTLDRCCQMALPDILALLTSIEGTEEKAIVSRKTSNCSSNPR
jgi:hypothetical protein